MKFKTLLGLGLVGSALYAHKRNGGQFTLDSLKATFNKLVSGAKSAATDEGAASHGAATITSRVRDLQ